MSGADREAGAGVERVAIIGVGTMGHGIAQVAATAGLETMIVDADRDALAHARRRIAAGLERAVERGKLPAPAAGAALARLRDAEGIEEAVGGADLVIEAVPEDIGLKLELLARVDRAAPAATVIASNTSALSITEMAAATARPQRVVGMHFFNPVPAMKLVEVVRGLETADATRDLALAAARRMGKEPVEVNESPGFVTSRINAMIGNEAFYLLQEGVASARDIDRALKLGLNHPMGPFELGDLVGLDTRLAVLEFLHATLGDKYRPCPLLAKYVRAGRLGRKVGRGVYEYEDESAKR